MAKKSGGKSTGSAVMASGIPVYCAHDALVDVTALVPNPKNPNRHGDGQVALLAKIIRAQGWRNPIVVSNRSGFIVEGHGRLQAAGVLQVETVPVDYQDYPSESAEWAAMIAGNRLAELAEMDQAGLSSVMQDLKALDFDMDMTGFDAAALELIKGFETAPVDVEPQIDRAAELQKEWKTETGQLWKLGDHRLICGDSTNRVDVERVVYFPNREPLSLIVTSPPYNQKINTFSPSGMHKEGNWVAKVSALAYKDDKPEEEYQNEQRGMIELWASVLMREGSFFYNHKNRYREKQVVSPLDWIRRTLKLRQEIIWSRPGSVTQNARMFLPSDERIYWLYHGEDFYFNDTTEIKTWSTVWEIGLETNKSHAVGFPIELPTRCISACSKPGQLVGEPYCGSGTTLIACENLNRKCRGIEISPAYCAVILQRFKDTFGKTPELITP